MASSNSNRDEIIELAQLEVVGALDQVESARLERLFKEAPVSVQRDVVELQARLCQSSALLPSNVPDKSLEFQVYASVARAVEAADDELAPIAAIGRPIPAAARSGGAFDMTTDPAPQAVTATNPVALGSWRRAALVWRAASIVLIGALVASIAFNIATARQATRISELALQRVVSDQLGQYIGSDLPGFLDRRCIVQGLIGSTARDNGSVTVMLSPDFSSLLVLWVELPAEQEFTLRSIDRASGVAKNLGTFSAANPVGGSRMMLEPGMANANSDWEVVDSRGVALFSSTRR